MKLFSAPPEIPPWRILGATPRLLRFSNGKGMFWLRIRILRQKIRTFSIKHFFPNPHFLELRCIWGQFLGNFHSRGRCGHSHHPIWKIKKVSEIWLQDLFSDVPHDHFWPKIVGAKKLGLQRAVTLKFQIRRVFLTSDSDFTRNGSKNWCFISPIPNIFGNLPLIP